MCVRVCVCVYFAKFRVECTVGTGLAKVEHEE